MGSPLKAQSAFEAEIEEIKALDWEDQLTRFREALDSGAGTPLQQARYHHELGVVYYVLDDLFAAIRETEEALKIRLENEPESSEEVTHSAYNLGSFYHNLENFDEAFAHFQLVLDRAPNSRLGYTLFRLGSLYRDMGEFQLGEKAFRDALQQSPFNEDETEKATLLAEWADLYLKQTTEAAARKAIPHLNEAYRIYHQLAATDDYYASLAALSLNRTGLAYTHIADYDEALKYFTRALTYNETCCGDDDLAASIHTNTGMAYRRMELPDKALDSHRKSLDIRLGSAQSGSTNMGLAITYDNLASTYLDLDQPRNGLEHIQQSLAWALPPFNATDLDDNPPPELLKASPNKNAVLICLRDKADLWSALADREDQPEHLRKALVTYRSCDQLIDLMREDHLEKTTKLYWREQARAIYQSAVKTAWKAGQTEEAFYFSEKSRAVLLLDGLRELNAHSRLPANIQKQLAQLASEIQYLEKAAYQEKNQTPSEQLTLLQERYRHLLDSVETSYPEYYRQKYRPGIIGLTELQQKLQPQEVWVEYFLADGFSLAFVITSNSARLVELAPAESFQPAIAQLIGNLKKYDSDFSFEPALELYQTLLAPLELPENATLIIVPDGQLSLIPFEVLLEKTPAGKEYRQWDFLLKKHRIHYSFSASTRYFTRQSPGRNNGRILAFAPMALPAPDFGIDETLELPQTRFTVEYLARTLPTDVLLGPEASRQQLNDLAPQAGVLHLATHAYLDHEQPEFSYLLVADKEPEQRRFYVNDLYRYQYQADLAVLSACETGIGKLYRGEGVASIGRAFAQNGCPNLTMSLWPVDESSTGHLLEKYYENLEAGMAKGEALHRAKLTYLEQASSPVQQHPFRWSGFVYYGQDTPLDLEENSWSGKPFWLVPALIVVLLFLFFRRKRPSIS